MFRFLLLSAVIILASCSSSTIYVSKSDDSYVSKTTGSSSVSNGVVHGKRGKIVTSARSFMGTKYRFGGTTKKGVDCSGLVYNAYSSGAGVKIPRSSNEQYKKAVATSNPKPGDLVFFKISSWFKIDHVGLYVGNNKMVHASPTYGVVEVSLQKEYYQERLVGFGRLLDE